MTDNIISATAASARESARATDGKFGFQQHEEPALCLTPEQLREGVDLTGLTAAEKLKVFTQNDDLRGYFEFLNRSAGNWAYRLRLRERSISVTEEDMAQEGVLEVLEKLEKVNNTNEIQDIHGLTSRMIQHKTIRNTSENYNQYDRQARIILENQMNDFRNLHGRGMSQREYNEAVHRIREDWPDQKHRPSKNWATPDFGSHDLNIVRLDSPAGDEDSSPKHEHVTALSMGATQDTKAVTDALTFWDEGGNGNKAKARRLMWNMTAELSENEASIPKVQEGCISKRQADANRLAINTHEGGVNAAINDWEQAEDNPAVDALFAPFGDLDMAQQQAVITHLKSRGNDDQPEILWRSAIGYADRTNVGK